MELGGGGSWWVKSSFSEVQSSMFLWLIVHIADIYIFSLFVFLYALAYTVAWPRYRCLQLYFSLRLFTGFTALEPN